MNILHGKSCPAVVCQSRGLAFSWNEGGGWNGGDELPERVRRALPVEEQERCERHRVRRLGMRRSA